MWPNPSETQHLDKFAEEILMESKSATVIIGWRAVGGRQMTFLWEYLEERVLKLFKVIKVPPNFYRDTQKTSTAVYKIN